MSPTTEIDSSAQEFALIVQQPGKEQQVFGRFLMLILNYRYGLDLITASTMMEGFSAVQKHGRQIRCTAVIQNRKVDSRTAVSSLSMEDAIPLILLVPGGLIDAHKELYGRSENILYCSWETALTSSTGSLQSQIEKAFSNHDIGELFIESESLSHEEMQQRVERRLQNLTTLPTLPEIALRVMGIVNDPDGTVEALEEVLATDPAIVHKVLQVVNSPVFAGSGHKGGWTLQEAIVRLGLRKVGAIAQQIKLMNALVKPEESLFEMRRFWEHSVGCAMIADHLYRDKMLHLKSEVAFNDYWIGALLHDCGKLVLGFFFWEHFEDVLSEMATSKTTFRKAEKELCDSANHEYLGRLLLLRSNVGEQLVDAVGSHHSVGRSPDDLTCLIHMANNLCKDMGKGYLQEEYTEYSVEVLSYLGITREDVRELQEKLGSDMVDEINAMVDRCIAPASPTS